jgi:Ca2+-binding EF-hand superfamily protein
MGTKLGQQEAMALKDIYRNFSAIDTNNNELISRSDIDNSQNRARSRQQMDQHLDAFRGVVARHRNTIDRNHDGQLSAQELATAGRSTSGLNEADRAEINWARSRR